MKISMKFLKNLERSNLFKLIKKVPKNDNVFEYSIQQYDEGEVTGTIYIENEIINENDETVGYFGVNFDHKIFAYNIKKEMSK